MKRRTSQQIEEEQSRTLYVRLPHTIKDTKQIKDIFFGNIKIKMPRQSARYCHVIFPSAEEKMKNLKNIKKLVIDGKHIIAHPPKDNPPENKKKKEKKVRMPTLKMEMPITKTLYIRNIKPGTKAKEIKLAFPGSISVVLLKTKGDQNRNAILKLGSAQLAGEYLRKEREWPEVRGNRLQIKPHTGQRNNSSQKKSTKLKIYDGETEVENPVEINSEQTDKLNHSEDDESDVSELSEEEEEDEDNSDVKEE